MRKLGIILALGLLAVAACREKRDPMRQIVDKAVDAAEHRDVDALGELISSTFNDPNNQPKAAVLQAVRRYFAAYKSIDLRVSNLKVEDHATFLGASFDVDFTGVPAFQGGLADMLPRTSRWNFWIEIENEDGTWRIVWAEWKELERTGLQ